jgi:hypothetical protein
MPDDTSHPSHKITLAEQRLQTYKDEFDSFVENQNKTNDALFNLIRQQGEAITNKLEAMGNKLADRGRITSSGIAIMVSVLTAIGGFVHWYVSDAISLSQAPLQRLTQMEEESRTWLKSQQDSIGSAREASAEWRGRVDERLKVLERNN